MRIVLVGFMACGKTTVGDLLAKKLNKLQIDLDQAIVEIVEREKLTIPEIFAKFGEDHFRLCEHRDLLANIGKDAVNHDRHRDLRNVLERSSARETTLRVYRPAFFAAAVYRPGGLCSASRASRS